MHANAFGVSITNDNLNKLVDYCNENLTMINGDVKYDVDFIWSSKSIPSNDVISIADAKELWGQNMDEPLVAIENIEITSENIHFLGKTGNTLKIDLPNKISLISFFVSQDTKEKLNPGEGYITLNAIGRCDKNEWMGQVSPQIRLEDFEITNISKWIF